MKEEEDSVEEEIKESFVKDKEDRKENKKEGEGLKRFKMLEYD